MVFVYADIALWPVTYRDECEASRGEGRTIHNIEAAKSTSRAEKEREGEEVGV